MEKWKDVVGYEGLYRISNTGKIFSLIRNRELNIQKTRKKYSIVILSKGGAKGKVIHRLVAIAFIPNPLNLSQVNHKDGDKDNNNDWNLEWISDSDNKKHAFKIGLHNVCGVRNPFSKLKDSEVLEIRNFYFNNPDSKLKIMAEKLNVSTQLIWQIKNRKCWKHI